MSCQAHARRQQQHAHRDIVPAKMSHNRRAEHGAEIVRCIQQQNRDHRKRQQPNDQSRELALRGQHADVALDAQPLADGLGDLFHDLGQVAADILLDQVRADDDIQILAVHAPSEVQQRVIDGRAEVDLPQHAVQFLGDRIAHFLGDKFQALDKPVARPQGIGEQHERVGQLFDELGAAPVLMRRARR